MFVLLNIPRKVKKNGGFVEKGAVRTREKTTGRADRGADNLAQPPRNHDQVRRMRMWGEAGEKGAGRMTYGWQKRFLKTHV